MSDSVASISSIEAIYGLLAQAIPSRGPADYGFLASTAPATGVSCVRAVVLRGFDPAQHLIWINTNVHTDKVAHLRHQPDAEVAIWLAEQFIQLRLRATWRVVDAPLAARNPFLSALYQAAWDAQPAYARKLYAGPAPEAHPLLSPPPETGETPAGPPGAFAVLLGSLYRIDAIRLTLPDHEHFAFERPRNAWNSVAVRL